jgi:hypothetical protein
VIILIVSIIVIVSTEWNLDLTQEFRSIPLRKVTVVLASGIYISSDLVLTAFILRIVFKLYSNFLSETSSGQQGINGNTQRQRKFRKLIPWTVSCIIAMGMVIILSVGVSISSEYHCMWILIGSASILSVVCSDTVNADCACLT